MGILADHGIDEKHFVLGRLCRNLHGWNGTGQSLRYALRNRCATCRGVKQPGRTPETRFFEKVSKGSGCWHWTGGITKGGYGNFCLNDKNKLAHRFSYEIHRGPIPEGMIVCHSCDNRSCVNPDHLFLGTYQDNTDDMIAKGRMARGEKHSSSKLSDAERMQIISLCRSGKCTQKSVAQRFGVVPSTVRTVLKKYG